MPNLRQQFLKHVAQTSEIPLMLEVESSEGIYLYDNNGKAYIDIIAGIGVSVLGHRHPRIVNAVKNQLDKYLHTHVYGEVVLSPQVMLATKLAENLPAPLDSVYFANSGSEAVEGAMKLAKRYTARYEIISCFDSYHGSTQGAASLMSDPFFTQAYRPLLPGIRHIEFNNENSLDKITEKTACVIVEPVKGGAGVRLPKNDYLKKLRARCDKTGALLILDEIQTGCGRTGSLFAFEQYGFIPDVLLLAKGLGGGMPIGVFIAPKEIMKVLSFDPALGYITTFGGHPVCCAAALATIEELLESDLISKVKQKEKLFRKLLVHPKIKEIRSAGLMMAVEFENSDFMQAVVKNCFENGLITDWFLFNDRSLRIAPPLIIEEHEIEIACSIILKAINLSL